MSYGLIILLCVFFLLALGYTIDDYCQKNNHNEFLEFLGCFFMTLGVLIMVAFIFIYFLFKFLYPPFPVPEVQSCFCNCDSCRK